MHLILATAVAAIATIAFIPFIGMRRIIRIPVGLICFAVVALTPCLVPLGAPQRLLSALVMACLLAKLIDLILGNNTVRHGFLFYATWLPNAFWLVLRRVPPGVTRRDDWRRFGISLSQTAVSLILVIGGFARNWADSPFFIEHCVKVIITYSGVVSFMRLTAVVWRLAGGRALDPMLSPWTAPTPADFWRRWNRPAQSLFEEYAFRPAGGLRHPIRAAIAAFVASGLVHEHVFGIAAGQVQGVQMLFFLVQGLATVVTMRLRPTGWWMLPAALLTISFNLVTSLLFFQSVNSVVPFYSARSA